MKLKDIKFIYDNTPNDIIKQNLKQILLDNKIKPKQIKEILNCSIHTAYSFTKRNPEYHFKPDLITLLILSEEFNIDIMKFLKRRYNRS